jgi:hypothetical protein
VQGSPSCWKHIKQSTQSQESTNSGVYSRATPLVPGPTAAAQRQCCQSVDADKHCVIAQHLWSLVVPVQPHTIYPVSLLVALYTRSSSSSMHSCLPQGSRACRTSALSSSGNSSMQRAAAVLQQHTGVLLRPSCRVLAAAAACRPQRLKACRHAELPLHQANHYATQPANSNSSRRSSSSNTRAGVVRLKQSAARVTRCYSTANPAACQTGPGSISWLCEVQAWPSQTAHEQTPSSNGGTAIAAPSSNGSANGAANGNGTTGSNGGSGHEASVTSSSNTISTEQDFRVLQAVDLPSMQFDAIVVLAGGLLPDGGLPVWAERRLDVGRDLHMMLGRKPPILCSGELAAPSPFKHLRLSLVDV